MRKLLIIILPLVLLAPGCKKEGCTDPLAHNYDASADIDDGSCEGESGCGGPCPPSHSGNVTEDMTWNNNGMPWVITGMVVVEPGVTLTIEPGTILKFTEGTGSLASGLIISQGATLNACGTATQPIILTSVLDNIQGGELSGSNLTENDHSLWAGIIILGNAPVSYDFPQNPLPQQNPWDEFGGNDPNDNSGSLCYVSIRHSGAQLDAGFNPGGLTLGGVGSGTQISNIEIVGGIDDGIDIYGGTVGVDNLFVGFMDDDYIDIDWGFDGSISDFIVVKGEGDEVIEAEGAEGTNYTDASFEISNGSVINWYNFGCHSHFRANAKGTVTNVDFNGQLRINYEYDDNCAQLIESCLFNLLGNPATLTFSNVNHTNLGLYEESPNPTSCPILPGDQSAAEALVPATTTTGNSNTDLGWTWLHLNGFL